MSFIESWEKVTRRYVAAGGVEPADEQKRQILVRRLPGTTAEDVYKMLKDYSTYASLRKECKRKDVWMLEYGEKKKASRQSPSSQRRTSSS